MTLKRNDLGFSRGTDLPDAYTEFAGGPDPRRRPDGTLRPRDHHETAQELRREGIREQGPQRYEPLP